MTDTIKKVCEAVGWRCSNPEQHIYTDADSQPFLPYRDRNDLHALVGTFEDLVREEQPNLYVHINPKSVGVYEQAYAKGIPRVVVRHDDWLMAKLEALWQVWEKLKEEGQ